MINTGTVQHVSAPLLEKLDTPKLTQTIDPQWTITSSCLPMFDASTIDTPFKFYIYDLPSRFNTDQSRCVEKKLSGNNCYNFTYCGMGNEMFKYSKKATSVEHDNEQSLKHGFATSVRNTHMFSLEVIMHYKLLHSPYRTLDAGKADMFYIPVYSGLAHLCNRDKQQQFIEDLFQYLKQNSSHFNAGKPHFAALGKIHREQGIMIRHPDSSKVTFIGIEQESNTKSLQQRGVYTISIIVAPYPSYIHFSDSRRDSRLLEYTHGLRSLNQSQFTLEVPSVRERNVLLLLAAGTRRSNLFRAKIIDQFPIQTVKGVNEYFTETTRNKTLAQIMLVTIECSPAHRHTTIPWMSRSVFCLQPPGDSPTRKSFYDGILSGCIPVTFKTKYKTVYPFQNRLDYKKFMYEISMSKLANMSVIDIIKEIPRREVEALHNNLLRVAKWFQYSMPDGGPDESDDAVTLILDEVHHKHGLKEEVSE